MPGLIGRQLSSMCLVTRAFVILTAVLLAASAPAMAQGVCVQCSGPAQVYSCSAPPDAAPVRGRALQFTCIQQIAKAYGHQQCAIRTRGGEVCQGEVHMLSQDLPTAPATTIAPNQASPEQARSRQSQPQSNEPKTVVEMAKRTADETNKQIDKSARVVEKAAKSTWQCLSSFFSDC